MRYIKALRVGRSTATATTWLALTALVFAACSTDSAATSGTTEQPVDTSVQVTDASDSTNGGADSATNDAGNAVADAGEPQDGATNVDGDAEADVTAEIDAGPVDTGPPAKVCSSGDVKCEGAKLATCGVQEDGWIISNCFPGKTCSDGKCLPVKNNLIVAFDSSGSMNGKVALTCYCGDTACSKDKKLCPSFLCKGAPVGKCVQKPCSTLSWPSCDPALGCSRMDISKMVFSAALDKIDTGTTRMALFRFPQKLKKPGLTASCTSGYYTGASYVSGEISPGPKDAQYVDDNSPWFWTSLSETMCVEFPPDAAFPSKQKMKKWLDGTEAMTQKGSCPNASTICKPVAGCGGACCSNVCYEHTDPELRPTGGTPIGKTLFYIGEYLRNRVVIDGKKCTNTADCGNVNYQCKAGVCKDEARSCRDTVVVLFTDGGQSNNDINFFAPWNQAKRLGMGLACVTDDDCVGGSKCKKLEIDGGDKGLFCQSEFEASGGVDTFCTKTNKPCLTNADPEKDKELYCGPPGQCVRHPQHLLLGKATDMKNNVLRSPDGKPFGVRLHVVDISAAANLNNSMSVALAGGGKLLGADAADPNTFLESLNSAFDIKNLQICGQDF